MKNLLNCHSIGLHSFPISFENGLYRRVFYASENHNLWKTNPLEIAIHPHHVDIKITVLDGTLNNLVYEKSPDGEELMSFKWNSEILNGNGGFERIGSERLKCTEVDMLGKGDYVTMPACKMHTVYVSKGEKCVWLIEEYKPTCDYFPINYSNVDLTTWTPEGLYIEVGENIKQDYLNGYKL